MQNVWPILLVLLLQLIILRQTMTEEVDVVVLSGQSNMAGRGGLHSVRLPNGSVSKVWDGIVPLQAPPGTSILRLNADLHWEDAREPLHADIDIGKVCGIGPGLTFAATMVNHGRILGLVPCARGATSIREWIKGSTLYSTMVERTKAALSQKKGSSLKALLWYQGESDTLSKELADEYLAQLVKFIQDIRTDLGCEDLPFIQVGITAENHPHPELLAQVRQAQQEIELPNVLYVDAQGLALGEDGVHLTTESQVVLGKKLAQTYNSLSSQEAQTCIRLP